MDDMTARKAFLADRRRRRASRNYCARFPTSAFMRRGAPHATCRALPIEYGDTGAGDDIGIEHNWAAFDNVKIVPRYGVSRCCRRLSVELFGTQIFRADRRGADGRAVASSGPAPTC